MHAKSDAIGMTQWVAPFLNWLRVVTIDPLQGIAALIRVDLADSTLEQRQGIRTSLVLLPPPPPSAAPEPEYFAASALPTASAGPTAIPHKAGGDARRAVGSVSKEPPPYLQCQYGIADPRHLEDGGATEKR